MEGGLLQLERLPFDGYGAVVTVAAAVTLLMGIEDWLFVRFCSFTVQAGSTRAAAYNICTQGQRTPRH